MKIRKKGFSLIEILLVIVITLLMLGGVFMLYNKIESDNKAKKNVEVVRKISANLYNLKNETSKLSSLTSDNVNNYLKINLPEEFTDDFKVKNLNNATTLFQEGQSAAYGIIVPSDNPRVCVKVFQQLYNSTNGLIMQFKDTSSSGDSLLDGTLLTPSQISKGCSNQDNSYYIIFNMSAF